MDLTLQHALVAVVVVLCLALVLRRGWRALRFAQQASRASGGGCTGCNGCPSDKD